MKRLWNLLTLWQRADPPLGSTPHDVVHSENKWRLLRYRPRPQGLAFSTPVLLIPSLINRHYVLDLVPGKSFVEYLVAQGHEVFIIDWGTPGDEDRYLTWDEICGRYIARALRRVSLGTPSGKAHVLGYCMGGTLASIHAAAHPERVASLLALAAPVHFNGEGLLALWVGSPSFDVKALTEAGNVPWQLMQPAFHMLKPTMNLSKAVQLVDRAWDDTFLDSFMAVEAWSNDNVAFPGACYRRYIEDLYQRDLFYKGEFVMNGVLADPARIECPVLAITFEHDHIVPWRSAAPLVDKVGARDKHHMHLPGGHVGAVVSRKAARSLWPLISQWWAERDGRREAAPPIKRAG